MHHASNLDFMLLLSCLLLDNKKRRARWTESKENKPLPPTVGGKENILGTYQLHEGDILDLASQPNTE